MRLSSLDIMGTVFFVIMILLLFLASIQTLERTYLYDSQIIGVVKTKCYDMNNHTSPKLIFGDFQISFSTEYSGIFNFVQVGDSLYKPVEDSILKVYRNDKLIRQCLIDEANYYNGKYRSGITAPRFTPDSMKCR